MNKPVISKFSNFSLNFNKIVTLGVVFIGILLTLSLIRNINTIISANRKIQSARNSLQTLQRQNIELKNQMAEADSPEFMEKQARDELGMAKSGEKVVILPDTDIVKKLSPIIHEQEDSALPDPNWKKWWKLFYTK